MKIETITLHHIDMPLVTPFETSFGRETHRPCILVEMRADGLTGWGECVAGAGPGMRMKRSGRPGTSSANFWRP